MFGKPSYKTANQNLKLMTNSTIIKVPLQHTKNIPTTDEVMNGVA